jgi:hypothetical protein
VVTAGVNLLKPNQKVLLLAEENAAQPKVAQPVDANAEAGKAVATEGAAK